MIYEVRETSVTTTIAGLAEANVGCTIDADFMVTWTDEIWTHNGIIADYEQRKDAVWDMTHDIKYANAICLNNDGCITICETHLHELPGDDASGFVEEYGLKPEGDFEPWEWSYQAHYTCVVDDDDWEEFATWEEAKKHAIWLWCASDGDKAWYRAHNRKRSYH